MNVEVTSALRYTTETVFALKQTTTIASENPLCIAKEEAYLFYTLSMQ